MQPFTKCESKNVAGLHSVSLCNCHQHTAGAFDSPPADTTRSSGPFELSLASPIAVARIV